MSPEEQMSEDELKMGALKLIQSTWKDINEEKKKGTDVAVAENLIIEARKAIKDKDFQKAYDNATAGSAEFNKIMGVDTEPEPAPEPEPEVAPEPEPEPAAEPELAPVPEPTGDVPMHESSDETFSFGEGEVAPMPEPVEPQESEVSAEDVLGVKEEDKKPKPMLFLCYNCNEPISVAVEERPLIVKCPNCGIDGQID